MLNNPVKSCLLVLTLIASEHVYADYNITVNIDGDEVSYDENGVSNNDAVSIEDDGSISISYADSDAKSKDDSAPTWGGSSKHKGKKKYDTLVTEAADKHRVDPKLVHAVIQAESAYNEKAVSPAGAVGLMQLMPGTARQYGVTDRSDPLQNIEGGTRYLKHLLDMFDSDLDLTLAAYNAGENAVIRYNNHIPPMPRRAIMSKRSCLCRKAGNAAAAILMMISAVPIHSKAGVTTVSYRTTTSPHPGPQKRVSFFPYIVYRMMDSFNGASGLMKG